MKRSIAFLFICCGLTSCSKDKKNDTLFELVDSSQSQIHFANTITTNNEINVIDFQYCYNGGGVGIGDFNSDGLPDIIFTGNQVGAKLYLNQGGLEFLDVTDSSGLSSGGWLTGVSIVDINSDGLTDVYLNVGGSNCLEDCANLLFVNKGLNQNGVPLFEEQALAYGLEDPNYSQQTVFFDYDLDGDLDAYILRNGNVKFDKNSPIPKQYFPEHLTDALLENTIVDGVNHPVFVDVSEKMGITEKGFGLGLGINDFDNNGLVDIYVGNDFISNDLLYMNFNKSGELDGFKEQSKEYFQHQTYNSMGLDIGDVNGDGWDDLLVLDMLPDDYARQKQMLGIMNYDKYNLALRNDYTPQFMRNTLHLNNGFIEQEPVKFSDISFLTNTAKTDWSWAPLIADYDADGDNDIFITNGYGKDITNLDFINYTKQNNVYGTPESRDARLKEFINELPAVKMTNYFFENVTNLEFSDKTEKWLPKRKTLSNGAAYADLDLDGDLDLVINNIDEKAYLLKNNTSEQEGFNYLKVKLTGNSKNPTAIGAKIFLWEDGRKQARFHSVIRGYLSSVEDGAFFGLKGDALDSLKVIWPNGKISKIKNVKPNQTLKVNSKQANQSQQNNNNSRHLFKSIPSIVDFQHQENYSNDFIYQHLLQTQHSSNGPIMVSASKHETKENLIYIGGDYNKPGLIWKTDLTGKFELVQKLDSIYEDTDALFFDLDNDDDLDLYVASGGNRQMPLNMMEKLRS